jgi:HTH-type transcriptional regulator/antitoxin HipB
MAIPLRIRRPEDIGVLIRARREELGWDQLSLAQRLGVSRKWVVEVESGKPKVQLDLVLRCLNELQTQLWAGTNLAPADPNPNAVADAGRQLPQIDIDSIADMGLEKRPKRAKP